MNPLQQLKDTVGKYLTGQAVDTEGQPIAEMSRKLVDKAQTGDTAAADLVFRILSACFVLMLIMAFSLPAMGQNLATVSGSNIQDLNGGKLATGTICFTGTDNQNNPISFQIGGGGQALRRPYCSPITAGVITSFTVPNPAATLPSGIYYHVKVTDSTTGQNVLDYTGVTFAGGTFNFDNYTPVLSGASFAPLSGTSVSGNLGVTGNVAATGTVTGSNIPGTIPGTGSCTNEYVSILNTGAPPTCSTAPLTTLGDIFYEASPTALGRVAGNTTTTKQYLSQTGTGTASAAPVWGTIAFSGLTGTAAIAQGGTGQTTAAAAFNALSPMTTLGDTTYESGANTAARLAGNTTTTKKYLSQTGTGTVSAAPSWQQIAFPDLSGSIAASQLPSTPGKQIFTSSGTFTIPAGVTAVKVTLVGGGGAGGGATATLVGTGGASGGIAIKWLTGLTPGNTITVTVGTGGAGVSGTNGNSGVASSISSGTQTITTVTANAGGGGSSGSAFPLGGGGAAGTSTNGDINGSSVPGITIPGTSTAGSSGGSTFLGGAGNVVGSSTAGSAAVANTGSGGGGAGSGATNSGGAGAAGIVIFQWNN